MSDQKLIEELRGLAKKWKKEAGVRQKYHGDYNCEAEQAAAATVRTLRGCSNKLTALMDKHADASAAEPCVAEKDTMKGK